MKIQETHKLFIVGFGEPQGDSGWITIGGSNKPVYVIAKDYNEAANKAMEWAENKKETASVITSDGSLNLSKNEIKINSIKICCDEIIF